MPLSGTEIWLIVLLVVGPAIIAVFIQKLKPIQVYGVGVLLVTLDMFSCALWR